jgi:hypothetical protein
MGGFVWLFNPQGRLAVVAVTIAAALVYAVMLVVLRTADDEDRSIMRRALGMRSRPPEAP